MAEALSQSDTVITKLDDTILVPVGEPNDICKDRADTVIVFWKHDMGYLYDTVFVMCWRRLGKDSYVVRFPDGGEDWFDRVCKLREDK